MRFLAIVALSLFLAACATNPAPHNVHEQFRWMVDKASGEGKLDVRASSVSRARHVLAELRKTVERDYPVAKSWAWEIHVAHYTNRNLYAFPNGKIIVFEGIFVDLKPTDDELAMAIAHEIAHVLLGHPEQNNVFQLNRDSSVHTRAARRNMELEADRIGLDIATRAGFKREAMVSLFGKWQVKQPDWSDADSWYPNWGTRINHATAYGKAAR